MNFRLHSIFLVIVLFRLNSQCKKIDLYIGGFFPIDNVGWNGSGLIPATQMAIDDINSRTDILPNHRLNLIIGNTKALTNLGVKVLFDFIHLPPTKIMLLGCGFARVTSAVAGVAKYYNLIQTTFSSESILLSDKTKYPNLFRTCFSNSAWSLPQVLLVKHFNWTKVATIARRSDVYDTSMERLLSDLYQANIEVLASEGFIAGTNFKRQIENLKAKDARIIIGHFQEEDALEVFCQAYRHGMYGLGYAWIVPGFLSPTFWNNAVNVQHVNCTSQEIAIAANYSLSVDFATVNTVGGGTISGMTPRSFNTRYQSWPTILNHTYWANTYAGFTYDAMWAEALALNNSLSRLAKLNRSLQDFHYGDSEMAEIFRQEMYRVNFSGISNLIEFDKFGDVHPHTTYLIQHQGNFKRKVATMVAKENLIDFYKTSPNIITWPGGRPPTSQVARVYVDRRVPVIVFIVMSVLSCIAIILAIVVMVYNNRYRNKRVIKMSSPNLNNLILAGCMILYLSIIIRGTISINSSSFLCMLAPWLTTIGFAIVSGSMFAKTYRAYKILTTNKRISPIHDHHLYAIVTVLILAETAILTTWTVIDPMKPTRKPLPAEASFSNDTVIVIPQLLECSCQHDLIWLATILTLNAFVLIFGGFLAYETRNIKLSFMNESKQIALCIYNVALLCIIVIPISFTLPSTFGQTYIASSALILYCTTTSICIFFIPKIKHGNSVTAPDGLLVKISDGRRSTLIRDKATSTNMESNKTEIFQ